jgi:hypothetical protein
VTRHDLQICFNARERGTGDNFRSIKRQDVEAGTLPALNTTSSATPVWRSVALSNRS